jgi:hypothetical protein
MILKIFGVSLLGKIVPDQHSRNRFKPPTRNLIGLYSAACIFQSLGIGASSLSESKFKSIVRNSVFN